jgi:hypothetical protein
MVVMAHNVMLELLDDELLLEIMSFTRSPMEMRPTTLLEDRQVPPSVFRQSSP